MLDIGRDMAMIEGSCYKRKQPAERTMGKATMERVVVNVVEWRRKVGDAEGRGRGTFMEEAKSWSYPQT